MDNFTIDLAGLEGGSLPASEAPTTAVLERNLAALAVRSPLAARAVRAALPRADAAFTETGDGVPGLTVTLPGSGRTRVLASRRRPIEEAERLADTVDLATTATVCVAGFGAGYHCRVLAERLAGKGVVLCYEPDAALLRAVLSRVDHSAWLRAAPFVLVTEAATPASITAALRGFEGLVSLGTRLLEHPPSRELLGDRAAAFGRVLAGAVRALRTSVMTTLAFSELSLRNMLMNLDHYATAGGIADLARVAAGAPAVVVSAGPSLARNIDALADPASRAGVVVIAAQTVLRPLLERGIRPDFVCALDHHEISRRFYEGLREEDLRGVTLVVEPKANPAILDAFPGSIRCSSDERLDSLLGPGLARAMGDIEPGGTVAHLGYYLARHLGCDPVILVGQDLGFTDGQYYSAGASIHSVWAPELGEFRTLEMLEWERVARQHALLHRMTDQLGRHIYTDEQMATYLAQFEAAFQRDAAAGLRVVDATEGGVRKRHTEAMPLREALGRFARPEPLRLPGPPGASGIELADIARRVGTVREQAAAVRARCDEAAAILERMAAADDPREVNALVGEVHAVKDRVRELEPAYGLVQFVNQVGTLRRYRADRAIDLDDAMDARDRQRAQIERDLSNVRWLGEAAAAVRDLLDHTAAVLRGDRGKATSDPERAPAAGEPANASRVGVVIPVDLERNGLGLPRDLAEPVWRGENALRLTVRRVLRTERTERVVLLAGDRARTRSLLGDLADHPRVVVHQTDARRQRARLEAVASARLWGRTAWRGGVGNLTCYDEGLDPALAAEALADAGLEAAVVVGCDWCLVDPALLDELVSRALRREGREPFAICQAAVGLGGMLVGVEALAKLGESAATGMPFASLGGLVAYIPIAPQADPIGKAFCAPVAASARDLPARLCAEDRRGRELVAALLDRLGERWLDAHADEIAACARTILPSLRTPPPEHLRLELTTRRDADGPWAAWQAAALGGDPARAEMPTDRARALLDELARRPGSVLTLHGAGDPLTHPGVWEVIAHAKAAGVAGVHVRTELSRDADADRVLASGADVISVDVLATGDETYERLAGWKGYSALQARLERLVRARGEESRAGGFARPWLVPRMTRCDEVYGEVENFYKAWLMFSGCAVLDPIPVGTPAGARIGPLPVPARGRETGVRERVVRSDGTEAERDPAEPSDERDGVAVVSTAGTARVLGAA